MLMDCVCPNCGTAGMSVFYELEGVPVHSVLLLPTREMALGYPRGDIALGFCQSCGFISNTTFDPSLHEYSTGYEATQAFSPTFNAFHRRLADYLIDRYDLRNKKIIEIGCGQGEFLSLLCELGGNRGIGFDPAYAGGHSQITFIKDFYSEKYAGYQCDFLCCKMTLEHIQPTAEFVGMVRRSIGDRSGTIVFFQVPDVVRILRELAFWDIYYEHCSYFSLGSLARLFRRCAFDVVDLWRDYDDQYLMIEARPGDETRKGAKDGGPSLEEEDDLEELAQGISRFSGDLPDRLHAWRHFLREIRQSGRRAVIWGAGSKGVAFLTTLNVRDEIAYAVDINPHKHGTYMAGTGQEIVGPEFLREYRPDVVIVMNPIYCNEIQRDLARMGVTAELIPVGR